MKCPIIEISKIVEGNPTYPSWSTGSSYILKCKPLDKLRVLVYYKTGSNRTFSRIFPRYLEMTPKLACILGLIKGEGANALGKSNYRRFTFTNCDWVLVKNVLDMLDHHNLIIKKNLPKGSLQLLHFTGSERDVVSFWSKKLNIPSYKFNCVDDRRKTTKNGVCHLYLSDVLLRRVIDLIIDDIL